MDTKFKVGDIVWYSRLKYVEEFKDYFWSHILSTVEEVINDNGTIKYRVEYCNSESETGKECSIVDEEEIDIDEDEEEYNPEKWQKIIEKCAERERKMFGKK